MFVRYLRLKNFKTIREREFHFDTPVTVLSGANGAGKSSVVEAIAFLLGDYLFENMSEYVNWGTDENAELHIQFEHLGIEYDYEVIIKQKGSAERKLILSTEPRKTYRNSDCIKKIKELYNQKLLLYSSIASQHEGTSILFEDPPERLRKLKQILDLERLENISLLMKEDLSVYKAKADALEHEKILLDKTQFRYQDEPILPDISQLSLRIEQLEKTEGDYKKKLLAYESYREKLNTEEVKRLRKQELTKKITEAKNSLLTLILKSLKVTDKGVYEKALAQREQIKQALAEYRIAFHEYNTYLKNYTDLENKKINLIQSRDAIVVKRLAAIPFDAAYLETHVEQINILSVKQAKLQDHLNLAKNGKCPTCKQDFSHNPSEIEKELDKITEQLNILRTEYVSDKLKYDTYLDAKKENDSNIEKRKFYDKQIEGIDKSLSELKVVSAPDKVDESGIAECDLIIENYLRIEKENSLIEKENQKTEVIRATLNQVVSSCEDELSKLVFVEIPETELPVFAEEVELKSLRAELAVYEEKVRVLEAAKSFNKKVSQDEKKHKEDVLRVEKEMQDTLEKIRLIDEARKILDKEFSSYLIDSGSVLIKNKMNDFFHKTYGRYQVDFRRDNKSVAFLYSPDGEVFRPVGVASGFERQALSLSFRVALASLQDVRFYILDEMDSSAEDNNSISMYSNLLDQKLDQVICITHKETTKEYLINERGAKFFNM